LLSVASVLALSVRPLKISTDAICQKKLQIANYSAADVGTWWKFSNFGAKTKNDRTMVNDMETNKGEIVMYQPDEASSEHIKSYYIYRHNRHTSVIIHG